MVNAPSIYNQILGTHQVVSIGHSRAFYVIFVPQEYILSIPPHSTFVIVICFILLNKQCVKP